jgi:putative peptide zinc metalloprotease protein
VLFQFVAPELKTRAIGARERGALLQARINRIGSDEKDRTARIVLLNELETTRKELRGLERLSEELLIKAQFGGVIVDLDPELNPGMWVNNKQPLALLHGDAGFNVKGYVEEADLRRFAQGANADFIPENPALARIPLRVETVSYAGAKRLDEPYLALQFGGSIATSDANQQELVPKGSYYTVFFQASIDAQNWQPQKVVRGSALIQGAPQSLFERAKRSVLSVLIREAGI